MDLFTCTKGATARLVRALQLLAFARGLDVPGAGGEELGADIEEQIREQRALAQRMFDRVAGRRRRPDGRSSGARPR